MIRSAMRRRSVIVLVIVAYGAALASVDLGLFLRVYLVTGALAAVMAMGGLLPARADRE